LACHASASRVSRQFARAQYDARSIDKALGVHLLEFAFPKAMWLSIVDNSVAVVTMDVQGNSLHAKIKKEIGRHLAAPQR
jgi:tartrate dehydratase beta subunit/fumarate hydratase class I family protein